MSKKQQLDELKDKMRRDLDLPLRKGATNLVFGEGDSEAEIFFLGEGPGYWEDIKGRPFVGNAGSLLNQLLHSIKVDRNDVFITNVVCFRPPENRDPFPEEIGAFSFYIDKMIDIIKPKLIITLGRFSMAKFLPGVKISAVHGRVFGVNWNGREIQVIPMYHPAAALRRGEILKQIREDFLKVPEVIREANKIKASQIKLI